MKKRIALAAAIALAISVGGMLPASAAKPAAPVVGASACNRAGGTLELKAKDGNITVALGVASLTVTFAGTSDSFAGCTAGYTSLVGLTSVILKATEETATPDGEGDVTITLTTNATTIANFGSIPMEVRADGELTFDGSALTDTVLKPFVGTITEEGFTIGSVTGTYYAGGLKFKGGDGNDSIDASAVTTTAFEAEGGDGLDTLKGGAESDDLTGDAGSDKLYGNGGDDFLYADEGGAEPECIKYHPNTVKFPGRCQTYAYDAPGPDEAWGGAGDDYLEGDGTDVVAPGDGADEIVGGVFQLYYGDSSAAITVNLTKEAGVVRSTAGDDFYGAAEEFVGSTFGDTMVGDDGANAFYGLDGADIIVGGFAGTEDAGDLLSGNGGTDKIKGGPGNDTIYGDTGADLINGGTGDDTIEMGGGDDVAYGSVGDDVLRGQKGSDQAWGGRGTFDVCAAEVTDSCEFKK